MSSSRSRSGAAGGEARFPPDVTALLQEWRQGDRRALDELSPFVYGELKRLAQGYMRDERKDPLLQTTALAHEAFLRLDGLEEIRWQSRNHFLAVSAHLMRRVLIDFARRRKASKRGGGEAPETLSDDLSDERDDHLLALDEALVHLAEQDERKHRVVELRYFGGATVHEIADLLGIAPRTVERDLQIARAWLAEALGPSSQR